ncbi:hypothetical protein [Flindersiella endophytica]
MRWDVVSSTGLDAVLLLGAAAGDVMQAELYPGEIEWARERLSSSGLAALATLDQAMRVEGGHLVGPTLAYVFSAAPASTLADVIASAAEPRERLYDDLVASPSWADVGMPSWERILALFPAVLTVLRDLEAADFEAWWAASFRQPILDSISRNVKVLEPYDVITEQAKLLGVDLEPRIEVVITQFAQPYGIRVVGQRFIAHHSYDPAVQLRNAAHEIFHPPFDMGDIALWDRLRELRSDPWMASIVTNHDPKFGYNSFESIVNEDSTQALDQIVCERLGFAHDRVRRWGTFDGGMHLLAAALFDAMVEDGFAETGGVYGDWLTDALDRGLLTPAEVRRRAALIVGEEPVARWQG